MVTRAAKAEPKSMAGVVRERAAKGQGPVVMHRTPRSSHVASVGYDPDAGILYVEYLEFKLRPGRGQPKRLRKGTTVMYRYYAVPEPVYKNALKAPSIGKYLWRRVYPHFRYSRIGRKGWRGAQGGRTGSKARRETFRRKNAK